MNFQLENIKEFYLFFKGTEISVDKNFDKSIMSQPTGQMHSCPFIRCRNDFILEFCTGCAQQQEEAVHLFQRKKKSDIK